MSEVLVTTGAASPPLKFMAGSWDLKFSKIADIVMPFDGSIVVPAALNTPIDFATVGHHDFLFLSFKYPETGSLLGSPARRFPALRDMDNRVVVTNKDVIFLIADDHSLMDDLHITGLFGSGNTFEPVFKENYKLSSLPRYFMIEFDAGTFTTANPLPAISPFTCDKDFGLKNNTSGDAGMQLLKTALNAATFLSGSIRAFDVAGRETETYSALINLGAERLYIDNAPDEQIVRVQFVDLHGEPLTTSQLPLNTLVLDPLLSPVAGSNYFTISFTGDDRKIDFKLAAEGATNIHTYHFHHIAIWPGYDFPFKEVENTATVLSLDLKKDFESSDTVKLTFVRICVFHPLIEFQTKIGGEIIVADYLDTQNNSHKSATFKDNKFNVFSRFNKLTVYNCGSDFFKDYYKTVDGLGNGERLYQVNWSSNPFVHLNGSMSVRGIEVNDLDSDSISRELEKTKSDFVVLKLLVQSKGMSAPEWRAAYLPSRINGNNKFSNSLFMQVWTKPGPGEFTSMTQKGFVREKQSFAWLLQMKPPQPAGNEPTEVLPHRLKAFWKNSMGIVNSVLADDLFYIMPNPVPSISFPLSIADTDKAKLVLETDDQDPPRVQISWNGSLAEIDNLFLNESADSLRLFVINLAIGGTYFLPFNPPGTNPADTKIVLTNAMAFAEDSNERKMITQFIDSFSGEDECLFAIAKAPVGEDDFLSDLLLTNLWFVDFSHNSYRLGNIPLHPGELGGLFRKAIKSGVEVRAMYWEQYLSQFSPGDDLSRGLNNNESITNVINREIVSGVGHRGFSFQDRSTRDFGSWHQKSSFILKNDPDYPVLPPKLMLSYLGGMDLTMGRWDTQLHFPLDPDRQSGAWYDVHVKISGEASVDVFLNFKQRWKAIKAFTDGGMKDFRPANIDTTLTAEERSALDLPEPGELSMPLLDSNAFVQINRTIPPRSSFSLPGVSAFNDLTVPVDGELGSLASYKHAFTLAKKFIIVNEQYFFSQDMALFLHDRLADPNGPDFLILVLPVKLEESHYIDPHLFRVRKLAIQTLWYGAEGPPDPDANNTCGSYRPHASGSNAVRDKVAIMTPVDREGSPVYVHSKHSIVDDVWMTIGSANMGGRSLTFDGEINAAIIGNKFYKGGTAIVRNHRIEICRQLLGLPDAYSALLQDPYATFRLFKAIEQQHDSFSFRLHPQPLHTKWLDPEFVVKVGEPFFDAGVDAVANLDFSDPSFAFLSCNILDPDGRSDDPSRLGFLASLFGVGKTVPSAKANIGITFTAAADAAIRARIMAADQIVLLIQLQILLTTETDPLDAGPFKINEYTMSIETATNNLILTELPTNITGVPISITEKYTFIFKVQNKIIESDLYTNTIVFDPATASPVITTGSVRSAAIVIGA